MVDRPIREWNGLTIPDPGVYVLDEAHKRLGFLAQHMMVSPIRGEFARGTATIVIGEDPARSSVTASIEAASITTHNSDRDTHLSSPDFLDVEKYPTLEYRSTGVQWQENNDAIFQWARLRNNPLTRRAGASEIPAAAKSSGKFVVNGLLTIRDVTRPVDLQVEYGGARRDPYGRDIFGFSATAQFEREDFGLVWNVALETGGFLVGKTVKIEIAGEAFAESNAS
ncbi:YceI family protein [Paractinoplanes atraurantiacus]|uniref:Polyisoprenoid-binding protein YceI n=1 Tax=Paractinoplanes atraurantiacus TaxID=1036182 RepID=A0A285K1N5_9ACTN|nr:YceI family protein [Actinoplanes atraurantiacus]SNY66475.1 Polyisoprenoid-binding protein YceI [Actinoplanes atraurantiacus]